MLDVVSRATCGKGRRYLISSLRSRRGRRGDAGGGDGIGRFSCHWKLNRTEDKKDEVNRVPENQGKAWSETRDGWGGDCVVGADRNSGRSSLH